MEDDLKESFGLIVRSMCYKARVKTLHILRRTLEEHYCDAPKSRGPLINRQPSKSLWMSGNPIPHYCVPFTRTHNLKKIRQSLLCTESSIKKNTTCTTDNSMTHLGPIIIS